MDFCILLRKTKYLPKDCFLFHKDCFKLPKDCFLLTHFYTRDCFIFHFEIVLYYTPGSKKEGGPLP